ncbi:MAG: Ig-like domain-containing protein [Alcanivoracaceae bacterium]|nr:Ig-like domain-containing protein [Alcanivoracaceae bacterium]
MKALKKTLAVAALFALAACGGDKDPVIFADLRPGEMIYSYPYDGQAEVSVRAPIVLRFSDSLTAEDEAALQSQLQLEADAEPGVAIPVSVKFVDDKRSVVLTPDEPLAPGADYQVRFDAVTSTRGPVTLADGAINFTTRAALRGPAESRSLSSTFEVARMMPDGEFLPVMDFSALRVQFTQPVDRASLSYGLDMEDSINLVDAEGGLVEAVVIAKDRYLTVDPIADLTPGETYTLTLGQSLASEFGNDLGMDVSFDVVPKNSRPRAVQVQEVTDSDDFTIVSRLTGEAINAVPVNATLLGNDTQSQQGGNAYAELAFVPRFPEVTPLRIPRGNLLAGSNVELVVAGAVPAGVESGTLSVTFISDAAGYLLPNTNATRKDAPKLVRLTMDVAMTAEDGRANGGLSQDLLHVEVAGLALVEDGVLTIDAVGVVEPDLLGVEDAFGLLSFHLEAYKDQNTAPQQTADVTGPILQSWIPGNPEVGNTAKQSPDDPVILTFDEPLDPNSLLLPGAFTVLKDDMAVPAEDYQWYLDGSALVINLDGGIAFNSEYRIQLSNMITDIAGNALQDGGELGMDYEVALQLPNFINENLRAPIATSVYPGFPCYSENMDLANMDHGQCAGGLATDDHLPVPVMPADRPIRVGFSANIDPASVVVDGSFRVERDNEGVWEPVPGRMVMGPRSLRFMPDQPWVDDGSVMYRYVLGSLGADGNSAPLCDGTQSICDVNGNPLQTRVLAQDPGDVPAPTEGGPDMQIYFVGGEKVDTVYQPALNLPATDVNSNNILDGRTDADYDNNGATLAEQYPGCTADPDSCEALPPSDGMGGFLTPTNATQLVIDSVAEDNTVIVDANVGCSFDGATPLECNERKFIHLTGALNAELRGPFTYEGPDSPVGGEPAVRVDIYPTLLTASSLDVYARTNVLGTIYTPTGPQVLRARYSCDDPDDAVCNDPEDTSDPLDRNQLIPGQIIDRCPDREVVGDTVTGSTGCPVFRITFDLYLDAPSLSPELAGVPLQHNVHSLARSVTLEGPVNTLADGRLEIAQQNADPILLDLEVDGTITIGGLIPVPTGITESINVAIPMNGVFLNYITAPAKE